MLKFFIQSLCFLTISHSMEYTPPENFFTIYPTAENLGIQFWNNKETINQQDHNGNTPFHRFVIDIDKNHDWTMLEPYLNQFIYAQASPNIMNKDNLTVLHLAAGKYHMRVMPSVLKKLLSYANDQQYSYNPANKDGVTPLHILAVTIPLHSPRKPMTLPRLFRQESEIPMPKTNQGQTPLFWSLWSHGEEKASTNRLFEKTNPDETEQTYNLVMEMKRPKDALMSHDMKEQLNNNLETSFTIEQSLSLESIKNLILNSFSRG